MKPPARARRQRLVALRTLMSERQERERLTVRSDINVTPLVDVVLVLLIIFMVVTPMIASGIAVDLPKTTYHARKPDDGRDIIVSITQERRVYVGTTRVERSEDLERVVDAERRRFPDKSIFLKGDARAPFGAVKKVMQLLHGMDIDDIVVGTEELQKAP
jgi:biopolymer transport protein TolR